MAGLVIWASLVGNARAEWLELAIEAPDAETAILRGLDRALVRLTGFRSDAVHTLVMELMAGEQRPWLHSVERRGAEAFRVMLLRDPLWTRLRDAGVPLWVGTRPSLLVWAVHEGRDGRTLLSAGMDPDGVLAALRDWAEERDFPLLLPLGDLVDRRDVRLADIVGGVTEGLQAPSARYAPDGIALLHVVDRASGPKARAWIRFGGREVWAEGLGADAGDAADRALGRAVDALGLRLATVLRPDADALIGFIQIEDHLQLRDLRARLEGIDVIQSARPRLVGATTVVMDVRSGLDRLELEELLQAEGFLRVEASPSAAVEPVFWLRTLW